MALTILFDIARSADFKSISVSDNGTTWGQGGEMGTGDVTGISLVIYGSDKTTALKTVEFTSGERTTFLAGNDVTLTFIDSRLWGTTYAPDNFYTCKLVVTGGATTSTFDVFDSYFYIIKKVVASIAAITVPVYTFYEASKQYFGTMTAMWQLEYLSSSLTVDRETKWRKIYEFLAWNYDL